MKSVSLFDIFLIIFMYNSRVVIYLLFNLTNRVIDVFLTNNFNLLSNNLSGNSQNS